MRLIERLSDPQTLLGRVPAPVKGIAWSLLWAAATTAVVLAVGEPWWRLAALAVALVSLGVTMWVCRA
jgi:membrane protein YdbS with pleckstrin-like domain